MITFVDQVGRTVIGKLLGETDDTIVVNNPVIIFVNPNQQANQLQVQQFPYLFMEFIDKDSRDKNNWTFYKSSIAVSDVKLDEAILRQYGVINAAQAAPAVPQPSPEPEVIKLFPD